MSTRGRPGDDFAREIEAHIQLETDRLIEEGMSPGEAAREAHRRFGNTTRLRERHFESGRVLWLDRLHQDLRGAFRSLRRYPLAAAVAVLSLAAGIAATTVPLAVRDIVFHKPPPLYRNPEGLSLVLAGRADRPHHPFSAVPAALFKNWRAQFGSAIAAATGRSDVEVRTADRTAVVPVREATANLFSLLGVAPAVGTDLASPSASDAGAAPAVLSHQLWQRLFDGRPDVAGQALWIDDKPHVVVGVMPPAFWFVDMSSPLWTALDERTIDPERGLDVVVRREPAMTTAATQTALEGGLADFTTALPAGSELARQRPAHEGNAARRPGVARAAVRARCRGVADVPDRLRQRRDPDDRAVDGSRA